MQPVYDYYVPYVTENTPRGERQSDLFSRLLREHIIILGTPIDDTIANLVCAQLLYLQYENADRDINLYINSPGGDITALFAIYDTMQLVKNPIATWCYGQAASAAAVLLSAGATGKRFALPHSRILLHQPYGGVGGQATDIEIQARELIATRRIIAGIYERTTRKPAEEVLRDLERDFYMTADEALAYGIIDTVVQGDNRNGAA